MLSFVLWGLSVEYGGLEGVFRYATSLLHFLSGIEILSIQDFQINAFKQKE